MGDCSETIRKVFGDCITICGGCVCQEKVVILHRYASVDMLCAKERNN